MVACIAFAIDANEVDSALSNPPSVVCAAAVAANACISTRNATSRRIASSFELLANRHRQYTRACSNPPASNPASDPLAGVFERADRRREGHRCEDQER